MPFSKVFYKKKNCKEQSCKVNQKNIDIIFKPDAGIIDEALKNRLFPLKFKICDCIIICKDGKIIIHEILCGKLTYSEYKDKIEQLNNCIKIVEELGLLGKVKRVSLQYKKVEDVNLKKKLINTKIRKFTLISSRDTTTEVIC